MANNTMMDRNRRQAVLLVDDTPMTAQYLKQQLLVDGVHLLYADTVDSVRSELDACAGKGHMLDLLVIGHETTAELGSEAVRSVRERHPRCPWISTIDCRMPAADLQQLLGARLADGPAATVAADNRELLLMLIRKQLHYAEQHQRIEQLQQQLDDMQQRFEHLLSTSTEAIAFIVSGCHLYANPAYLELLGIDDTRTLESLTLLELLSSDGETDLKQSLKAIDSGHDKQIQLQCTLHPPEAEAPTDVIARLQPARFAGEDCIQLTLTEKPAEVEMPSGDQQLPGYLPKQAFLELSENLLQEHTEAERAAAVLCIRIDRFNDIQENIGLLPSEQLFEERAALLRACIDEEHDLLTHYSEYLFLATVVRGQRSAIEQLGDHIVKSFSDQLADVGDNTLTATCSIGYAIAGRQNRDINQLILNAARAAREAEQHGGNASIRYRPHLRPVDEDESRGKWLERLRHALDNNELMLSTSRISDIGDDQRQLCSLDLCLKDTHSDTIIYSNAWRKPIEGAGLQAEIDKHLIRLAMQQKELLQVLNLIPIHCSEHDGKTLADWIVASLKHIHSRGDQYVLMLDSAELRRNMQSAVVLQRALKATAVRFGLDLSNSTENAEQLLNHLHPAFVRMCSSVLQDGKQRQNTDDLARLAAIAKRNNAEVIACSVDTAAIVPALWQTGIRLIEGEFIQQHPAILEA